MEKLKLNIQLFADGKVVIETLLNNDGFKKGLDKVQDVAKKGFKGVATATGVAAGAITALVGKSVIASGELEQQIGGTEAVFKNFAKTVQDKAGKAFETMGVSANDFMATANKMGALMQGSGIGIEQSMDLSTKAMQRAADVASIMGIDLNSAMESVAGAAKGNFTMMDNLGVAMNATTIESYALSKGIKKSYNEMENSQKIQLAMEMFLEKTAYAAGNYAKENKTFAGSFSTLKAATSNFLSGSGGIKEVGDALMNFSEILMKSIGEMAPKVTEGIIKLVNTIIPQIPPLLQTILPIIIQGATDMINGLIVIFPALLKLIQDNLPTIIQAAFTLIGQFSKTIMDMLPQILELGIEVLLELVEGITQAIPDLIPTVIDIIGQIVQTLLNHLDEIIFAGIDLLIALIDGLIEAIPELIDMLPEIIATIVTTLTTPTMLMKLIAAGVQLLVAVGMGLMEALPQLITLIPRIIYDLILKFREGKDKMLEIGEQMITGLWDGIKRKWDNLKEKVANLADGITKKFKAIFGIHSPSRVFRDEIGKQLSAGIGVGFEDELDNVYKDMQKAINTETSKLSANVQTSGTYQMAMSGIPDFNLIDKSQHTTQLVADGKVLAEVVDNANRNREVARA